MTIKERISQIRDGETSRAQFIRFIINGCVSAAVHYGVYLLLLFVIDHYINYIE